MEPNEQKKTELNQKTLIENIQEMDSKENFLLNKENIILSILSCLQDKIFPIPNKLIIIRYLEKCLTKIPFNLDLLLSQKLNNKNLYHIIIYQFIINYDEKEYYDELKNLFSILLKNTSYTA